MNNILVSPTRAANIMGVPLSKINEYIVDHHLIAYKVGKTQLLSLCDVINLIISNEYWSPDDTSSE